MSYELLRVHWLRMNRLKQATWMSKTVVVKSDQRADVWLNHMVQKALIYYDVTADINNAYSSAFNLIASEVCECEIQSLKGIIYERLRMDAEYDGQRYMLRRREISDDDDDDEEEEEEEEEAESDSSDDVKRKKDAAGKNGALVRTGRDFAEERIAILQKLQRHYYKRHALCIQEDVVKNNSARLNRNWPEACAAELFDWGVRVQDFDDVCSKLK